MSASQLVSQNEEYIRDAINNGIDAETVNDTLERVVNYDKNSNQVVEVVQTIANMKNEEKVIRDERYLTELVRDNNSKIKSALNDGISPREIAATLVDSLGGKQNDNNLTFIVKLICAMKKQEIKIKKSNNYQKQFIKE